MRHDDARALQGAREFRESSRRSFLIGSAAAAVLTADLAFTRVIQSQRDQNIGIAGRQLQRVAI